MANCRTLVVLNHKTDIGDSISLNAVSMYFAKFKKSIGI